LLADHQSRNAIEAASAATVAVKTPMGYGSGFFYLYCRPHHHQQTRGAHPGIPGQQVDSFFDGVDDRIETIEKRFAEEQKRLKDYAAKLGGLKRLAEAERDGTRKQSYESEYRYRKKSTKAGKMISSSAGKNSKPKNENMTPDGETTNTAAALPIYPGALRLCW
jgi:serine protease Do